jgi:hypothetical protein
MPHDAVYGRRVPARLQPARRCRLRSPRLELSRQAGTAHVAGRRRAVAGRSRRCRLIRLDRGMGVAG